MNFLFRITPWIILAIPFVVLACFYNSIENEVLVMRNFDGSPPLFAPKSLFTVFRVPLIEVVCAALIETIRPRPASFQSNNDYFSIWNVLLYAVAFKSLFQVFEFISLAVFRSPAQADFFFYVTLAVVVIGICLAIIAGRKEFSVFRRNGWKLPRGQKAIYLKKAIIVILLIGYLVLAFLPSFIYKTV